MLENIIMLHISQILFIKIIYICHHQKGGDCWNKFGSGNISLNVLMSNKFYLEQSLYTNIFYARSIYDCCTGQAQLKRSSDSDQVSLQNLRISVPLILKTFWRSIPSSEATLSEAVLMKTQAKLSEARTRVYFQKLQKNKWIKLQDS